MYNVHYQCGITEGGVLGLTLFMKNMFNISPSITSLVLDTTAFLLGFRFLGWAFAKYSMVATLTFSMSYAIWESFPPVLPSMAHLPLLAALVAGLFVGVGVGIVARVGGACGGDDALALVYFHLTKKNIAVFYFVSDAVVLGLSLLYLQPKQLVYSFITVSVSSFVISKFHGQGGEKLKTKLIAVDLDDTLLRSDKTISEATLKALQRCKERGILIAVATARSQASASRFIAQVQPDIHLVNGGATLRIGEKTIYEAMLSQEQVSAFVSACYGRVESITMETATGYYVDWEVDKSDLDYGHGIKQDFSEDRNEPAYKLTLRIADPAVASALAKDFPRLKMIAYRDEEWYRFASPEATKGKALTELAQYLGFSMEEVVAFGDDTNDLEMLSCCIGVAMENALPSVKAVAKYTCPSNNDDGIAQWLEEFLLSEK